MTPQKLSCRCSLVAVIFLASVFAAAGGETPPSTGVKISNEFLRIRVNPGPKEAGRFAVDTTGGDPSRQADDDKVLIYGSREPWTSYTTVVVEGETFLFGGTTTRRAGRDVATGTIVQPPLAKGETIVCVARMGEIEVKQELGFARSPTTRVKDAARIVYYVTNRGDSPQKVGLRIALDTMLGTNDGAPLRAGKKAISTATRLLGTDLPDYWQAFDSLSEPAVIAQGTLRGNGLTPPDRLEMIDWGTLADEAWDFDFPSGASFTRRGEQEQDTAVALYWDPAPLKPGESRTYATLYGIGGVTLSPAQLSLGMTAPAEVDYAYDEARTFPVVVYLQNAGGFDSRRTTCSLELPRGLKLEQGETEAAAGLLKAGETRQFIWKVMPTGEASGPLKIGASATSENLEPNRVEREIIVNSPPQLDLVLIAPNSLSVTSENRYSPNPFIVEAAVANRGAQTGKNLVAALSLPDGLKLTEASPAAQVCERLEPGGKQSFKWMARALGMPTGEMEIWVRATAAGARPVQASHRVSVPELTPELRVYPADQIVPEFTDEMPTLVPMAVKLAPAREFSGCMLSVSYDPAVLEPLYVSRGEAFVEGGRLLSPWSAGRMRNGRIANILGERREAPLLNAPETMLFTIVFIVKGPGESAVSLDSSLVFGAEGKETDCRVLEGRVIVQSEEEMK
ncbi:MAG: hypothetical protein GTO55_04375 [Armatimonadetes bacterium]|nr:hypothetical protein [Armatimonadota bacterium]NIM23506.1 hypothetical protein [Armatimonadota bacterium]NIM67372.1 hypothetical protein [Armatimonadota bacterium]NIM75873.1 hypothetical protein [Armatimonadota bacterium]NIN05558.1 hypothetical protein [Armatimonadota bacterium]